ncbi:hypothetical protein [Levilactobacillus humaensis]|uniref:hypothetical protein n=1 Tax=Levilactobacillus humaensis TaxID=2950375 RepID=UPI0021C34E04|nr:hypothetical protein [Levilactobacillus humaensis]
MFKTGIKVTAIAALLLGIGLFSSTTAHAQSGYKITSTQDVTPEPYYVVKNPETRYSWNKTHTKKIFVLKALDDVSWYVTQKVTLTQAGKSILYYHILDSEGFDWGYVSAKDMRKGFNPIDDERADYQPVPNSTWNGKETVPINPVTQRTFTKVSKQIVKNQYYRTKKAIKIKAYFSPYITVGVVTVPTTLPAGTIVEGEKYSKWISFNITCLSRGILQPGYHQGLWPTKDYGGSSALAKNFKRVSHPDYLPKSISHGALYLGSLSAIRHAAALSKQSVQITSDGYVEVRQNQPWARPIVYTAKPKVSVKIKRTRIKGHTRYLYLAKPLKGFKTTKVRYHGKNQYRLAFVNQQRTYSRSQATDDNDYPPTYYGIMSFGGKTFYTEYNEIPYDD